MSISVIITLGIIGFMFAWVLFLNHIWPDELRSDDESPPEKKEGKTQHRTASVSSLSSKRLANQSGDFLHALSTRGEREIPRSEIPRSQAGSPRVSPGSCAE
jgi:hypothetical protein